MGGAYNYWGASGTVAPIIQEWTVGEIELSVFYVRDKIRKGETTIPFKKVMQFVGSYMTLPIEVRGASSMEELVNVFVQEFKVFNNTRKVLAEMEPNYLDYLDKALMLR